MLPQEPVTIAITLHPSGEIGIGGPIDNKLLCLGLIELAKKAILDHKSQPEKLITEVPPGSRVMPFPFKKG